MLRRPTKRQGTRISPADEGGESLHEFLLRELPPGKTKQAPYFTDAVTKAAERYDRHAARRSEWLDYAARRNRLRRIARSAESLASELCALDILSRDNLSCRSAPEKVEALLGSLRFLNKETTDLAGQVQENGRPRDLAEEQWILELADIYENAFCKPASVWGSGDEPAKRRGKFYRLLEVGRPSSFPRYGKLTVRQVDRTLRHRRKRSPIAGLLPSKPAQRNEADG
jgi:hypothetical protein